MVEPAEELLLVETDSVARPLLSPSQRRLSTWIKQNIKKKECCFYVEDESKGVCMCGHPRITHAEDAFQPDVGETWNRHRHIREVPTDAYGDISVGKPGRKMGKYVRVSTDTSTDDLYKLMTEYWELRPPKLLISVMGGAQYDSNTLTEIFCRGLIGAIQTAGAWILTGGTIPGVMNSAFLDLWLYLTSSSTKDQIVAIGVAPWGIVHNRESLVNPEGCFPAHFSIDEGIDGSLSYLENNHFLLVDDGMNGRDGVEIAFRSRLEKLISHWRGLNVAVVCLVLGGGLETLDMIHNAMFNGTPCVILEGSGRLADVIAQVVERPIPQVTLALIRRLMMKFFGQEFEKFQELQLIEWTKKIQDILRTPQLLTVLHINEEEQRDADVVILRAFVKASLSSPSPGLEPKIWEQQLELAMTWNRPDIAKSEIFTKERQWKSSDLHEAMRSALVRNKPDFVKLLLENGVSLRKFLTVDTLVYLYSHLEQDCLFEFGLSMRLNSRGWGVLDHVSDEVEHYLGLFTEPIYHMIEVPNVAYPKMLDTGRDFFLWAILQNRKELAEIAWEQCGDSMCAALAASKILKKLSQETVKEGDEAEADKMQELANYYEKQAIAVLNECCSHDQQRAQELLNRISPSWGRTTCLRLALAAHDRSFVAHGAVQRLLTQIWCGELAVDNHQWKILLCMLFFPLIYTRMLTFRCDEDMQRQKEGKESVKRSSVASRMKCHYIEQTETDVRLPTCASRLVSFFYSTQIKFCWSIVSYFGFLWLFACVLMMDFQIKPSWKEYLLYGWLASLVCEEIRQVFGDPDPDSDEFGFRRILKMYISDLWNILDVLSILLFIIGLAFRLTTALFYVGKVILCIDFIIFCLRLMAVLTISKTLGPKIIIVKKMMQDLFSFMFLLSFWVVAYGVAKQGIQIHNEERLNWIIRGAVYEPYLIIFGNVPTNNDNVNFDMGMCSMNGTDPVKPKCPILNANSTPAFPEWLTIILMCVYLLFTNILLLNLLIAIFNFTFQKVQDDTDTIWNIQYYELIKEYYSRPPLPPPFIIISHLYHLIRRVVLRKRPRKWNQFRIELDKEEEGMQLNWEALMKENYLASSRRKLNQSMERRIQDTSDKVGVMVDLLEGEHKRESLSMAKRLAHLEEQASQSTKALQEMKEALKSQGYETQTDAPVLSLERNPTDQTESQKEKVKEKTEYHVNARRLQYPGSHVRRFPVPEEMVPWEVEFVGYDPPVYNADEETISAQLELAGASEVNLNSYRNPEGRTGMQGKGALNHLGPNQVLVLDPVLTRWRDDLKSALEFLAVWDEEERVWTIPGGPLFPDEVLSQRLESILGRMLHEQIKYSGAEVNELLQVCYVDDERNTENAWVEMTAFTSFNLHLHQRGALMADLSSMGPALSDEVLPQRLDSILVRKLHEQIKDSGAEVNELLQVCYVDDERNTDNAWVEMTSFTAFNLHLDQSGALMADLNSMAENSRASAEVRWIEVSSSNMPVACGYQREVLRRVAELHGRHF